MNINVIGSADGPTSILITESTRANWINVFGLIIVVLMLLPNILYAIKVKGQENKCKNVVMNVIEQLGRYASMFFMIFQIGLVEFGFYTIESFIIYFIGNIILLVSYWSMWIIFLKRKNLGISVSLAIIPTLIFLLSGITLRNYLLVLSALVFGIGHIYVTYQNAK